jgi:HSP20 family protein
MNEITPTRDVPPSRLLSRSGWEHPFSLLQQETDRLFEQFRRAFGGDGTSGTGIALPSVDITDRPQELVLEAEVPGWSEKDIQISVQDGVLTLRGAKSEKKEEKDATRSLLERRHGAFMRTFQLPPGIDEGAIKATLEKGVLTVTLPKRPEAQSTARRIEIAAAR